MPGGHGKAATFLVICVYYAKTYLMLHHAVKTNGFTLFGDAFFSIILNLF